MECAAPLLSGDSGEAGAVDGVVLAAVEKLGDKQQQQQTLSPTSSNASKLAQQAAMEEGRLGKAAQIKSPPGGTTLQYRVTRSMSTRGSGGAISPPPLSGMSRAGSLARSGSARAQQQAARRRRCVPLRLQLGTFGMAFLAVAALLGLGDCACTCSEHAWVDGWLEQWWCCSQDSCSSTFPSHPITAFLGVPACSGPVRLRGALP